MASNDKWMELLSRFPGPVVLDSSRKKWLLVLLGGVLFTAGGILMIRSGDSFGWYVTIFFALVAICAVATMLPGAGYLSLDKDGFEARSLFRGNRTRWSDTKGFEAKSPLRVTQRLVVYDDLTRKYRVLTGVNAMIVGHNAALGDTYGLAADDL